MNAFERFIHFFQTSMPTPTWFGWFHLIWLVLMIGICSLVIIFRKKISQKSVKYILLSMSCILIFLEIIKQLEYSFHWDETTQTASWDYQWYAFPFQFCSTPMYIMLMAGLCKKNLFRDALYSYLATFALFAGLCVMIYPGDVFCSTIYINFQTMIWHSSMVIIGVLLWATNSVEYKHKTFLKALCVFASMLVIALFMNFIWKWSGGLETGETFNMFFISPYYTCTLPILSEIFVKAHYIVFLLCYTLGFCLAGYIFVLIPMAIKYINNKILLKKQNNKIDNGINQTKEEK